jgi:hypothetical protein
VLALVSILQASVLVANHCAHAGQYTTLVMLDEGGYREF